MWLLASNAEQLLRGRGWNHVGHTAQGIQELHKREGSWALEQLRGKGRRKNDNVSHIAQGIKELHKSVVSYRAVVCLNAAEDKCEETRPPAEESIYRESKGVRRYVSSGVTE